MDASTIYLIITGIALILIIIGLVFIKKKSKQKPSNLLNAAILILVFSMFFDERIIAYPLLGLAVVLAIIDAAIKLKKKK